MDGVIIDDMGAPHPLASNGARWEAVSDRVMGGLSEARIAREDGVLRLSGTVSLANDGGFAQAAIDLAPGGGAVDARRWAGVGLRLRGDGGGWACHLRTTDLARPWQSYRQRFAAGPDWADILLPFAGFAPHRTDRGFDPARLRRLGLVALGEAREIDLRVARVWLYA